MKTEKEPVALEIKTRKNDAYEDEKMTKICLVNF